MDPLLAVAVSAVVGVVVVTVSRWVLRRLPEPPDDQLDEGESKIPYAALGTPLFLLLTGTASAIGTGIVVLRAPAEAWPAWVGLCSVGVLLAAIDAATTWLPLRLTRVLWGLAAAGILALVLMPTRAADAAGPTTLERMLTALACALALWLFFGVAWFFSRGALGFGDVRIAPVLGAAGGAVSWDIAAAGLLAGCLIGAAWGVVNLARRRPGQFPYAPSQVAGSFLALALFG
ncbi:MAG: prepilin peptidase [Propionibacteriales bacterium]|nr:prepilin peptidase [Propionibacteriales bacterium]